MRRWPSTLRHLSSKQVLHGLKSHPTLHFQAQSCSRISTRLLSERRGFDSLWAYHRALLKWLRGLSAKQVFVGPNPTRASTLRAESIDGNAPPLHGEFWKGFDSPSVHQFGLLLKRQRDLAVNETPSGFASSSLAQPTIFRFCLVHFSADHGDRGNEPPC